MIYADANSTSQLRPIAQQLVRYFLLSEPGSLNPSSVHSAGRRAKTLLRNAREDLLRCLLGPDAQRTRHQLIFTSGGTESCNLMLSGFLDASFAAQSATKGTILVSDIEHPAVTETLESYERRGWKLTKIAPSANGFVVPDHFVDAMTPDTELVVLIGAHNETGAVQPVGEVAKRLRLAGYRGPLVSDCSQAFGKCAIDFAGLLRDGVSAIALSGHKLGAPVGAGALLLASSKEICYPFQPCHLGGPQEGGMRAGTENVLAICAWAAVARELIPNLASELKRIADLRESLWSKLFAVTSTWPGFESVRYTARDLEVAGDRTLANTLLVGIPGWRGDDFVVALDLENVCISTGSACSSGKQQSSKALAAMGFAEAEARSVVRISLDWNADQEMVDRLASIFTTVAERGVDVSPSESSIRAMQRAAGSL